MLGHHDVTQWQMVRQKLSHKACSVKQMMVIYTETKTNGCLYFDAAGMEYNLSLTDPAPTHSDIDFSDMTIV